MIHIIEALLPGQTRGISEMVAALKQMKMTRNFQEVTLQNAIVNATYAAAIESELPSDVVFNQMGMGQTPFGDILKPTWGVWPSTSPDRKTSQSTGRKSRTCSPVRN
ncbi:portal protein [Salmonella phage 35]|uniref:Portal protein n=1 Tax=Salmonella phage 35 TaxID=1654888 RepID=A0A0N7CFI7_9CAUD|nr:portal protein [Salmonella phage 35]AKJ74080.1 portal protein [Salmonella phage 35]